MGFDRKDLGAGAFFLAVASLYGYSTWINLPIGEARAMGPGYFPILLSGLIGAIGLFLVGRGFFARPVAHEKSETAWRALLLISAAIVLFGSFLREIGLFLATSLVVLLAVYAGRGNRVRDTVLLALALAGFATLVFGFALRLPIPLIGTWFTG